MRARLACSISSALLALGGLVMAPPAMATPTTPDQFAADLSAAVTASGVFTPGTTIVVDVRNEVTGAWGSWTTNPDGSLTWHEVTLGGTFDMKCIRVGRCWERSAADFDDLKWHRLPARAVTYRLASAAWSSFVDQDWSTATSLDVGVDPSGAHYFSATMPDPDAEAGADADVTLTHGVVVSGHRASYTLAVADAELEPVTVLTLAFRSQADPIVVRPPTARTVGAPATRAADWLAEINN